VIAEMTEALDHCIANRRALEPELRGWLGGLKIPRPTDPAKDAAKKKSKGR
jgi:hypothetical protein